MVVCISIVISSFLVFYARDAIWMRWCGTVQWGGAGVSLNAEWNIAGNAHR